MKAITVDGKYISQDELSFILPFEHLFSSMPSEYQPVSIHEPISLSDLADLRDGSSDKYAFNLQLSSVDEAFRETETLNSSWKCNTVIDITSAKNGRDISKLKMLAERSGLFIIAGASLPAYIYDAEACLILTPEILCKDIERELYFGMEGDKARAGVIGEVQFPVNEVDIDHPTSVIILQALSMAQRNTGAPLFITLSFYRDEEENTLKVLEQLQVFGCNLGRVILCYIDRYHKDLVFLEKVLDTGVNICFNMIGLQNVSDVVSSSLKQQLNRIPTNNEIATSISKIVSINERKFLHQIVLSHGVFQKTQLVRYGGGGYTYLFKKFVDQLNKDGVGKESVKVLLRETMSRLLCWWVPGPSPEIPKERIACSICSQLFEPIEGAYFTKFTFIYCSTKCLRKHREQQFKALEH